MNWTKRCYRDSRCLYRVNFHYQNAKITTPTNTVFCQEQTKRLLRKILFFSAGMILPLVFLLF